MFSTWTVPGQEVMAQPQEQYGNEPMIEAILAFIPSFRRLQYELQQTITEKLILQDRLDAMAEDNARRWDLLQEALKGERTAYQMHINAQWQRQGFGAPYPDAPSIPKEAAPKPVTDPIIPRHMLGSEVVRQRTNSVVQEIMGRVQRTVQHQQ